MKQDIIKLLLQSVVKREDQNYALYIKTPTMVIEEYAGYETLEHKNPIDENSNFRIASISKQFFAYALLSLLDEYNIKVTNTLDQFFDDVPEYLQNITLYQLLTHTSGIYNYGEMQEKGNQIQNHEVLEYIKQQKATYFKPGTSFKYNNTGYILLAIIIEKLSNRSIEEFMKTKIFQPLNMRNTVVYKEGVTHVSHRVYGCKLVQGKQTQIDQDRFSATIGDGGIYSSIKDMKKWLKFIKKNRKHKMFNQKHLKDGQKIEYGYGIRLKKIGKYYIYYHCGGTIGTHSAMGFIPKYNVEFLFFTNQDEIDANKFVENVIKLKEMRKI